MRRRLMLFVVVINAALAVALLSSPAASQILPAAVLSDCCEDEGTPEPYCCFNCCMFVHDCEQDEDCEL